MVIISAPTIIISFDDSVDVSYFYGMGEEEEESENVKLLFDNTLEFSEELFTLKTNIHFIGYAFKSYPKPHLNLISPPPEFIS